MNNEEHFEATLIECLAAMEAGEGIEQLLARHPADAARLGAALRTAARLAIAGQETRRAMPTAQEDARATFLAQAALMSPHTLSTSRAPWLVRPLTSFLAGVVLLVVLGGSVFGASASSLPGDPLYRVKRSLETAQLSLVRDPVQRADLEASLSQRRVEEVKAIRAAKRAASVEFVAPVEMMNDKSWTIGGIPVQVGSSTVVEGKLHPEDYVQVTGHTLPDGQIMADRIQGQESEFAGIVEAMNAQTWSIDGQQLLVTSKTQVTGTARTGTLAKVRARTLPGGIRLALTIEFDDHGTSPLSQPTATPMPQPTTTPHPTQIPAAPPQPTDTLGRERNGVTPEAGDSDDDHATPEPRPSERHDEDTPEPTESHDDSHTREPEHDEVHTPEPEHGEVHTPEHDDVHTPEPGHDDAHTPEPGHDGDHD